MDETHTNVQFSRYRNNALSKNERTMIKLDESIEVEREGVVNEIYNDTVLI